MMPTLSTIAHTEIENIASTCLGIETLESRNSDSLDFHNVGVWSLKQALEAAYLAGMVDRFK